MSNENSDDSDSTDAPLEEGGQVDVLAEKKRLARRRILMGTAAAGAVLGTVNRAHAVGASVCFSNLIGQDEPGFLENISHGNWQDEGIRGGIFRLVCGPGP